MAATIAGSWKAFLEPQDLGITVYRDAAPVGAVMPYFVVQEGIAVVPARLGDDGVDEAVVEQVQGDLFERWRNDDRSIAESYSLARTIEKLLRRWPGNDLPFRVHGIRSLSRTRQLDRDAGVVRNILTVGVGRDQ